MTFSGLCQRNNPVSAIKKRRAFGTVAPKRGQLLTYERTPSRKLTAGPNADRDSVKSARILAETKSILKGFAHRLPHPILLATFLLKYALSDLHLERKARVKNKLILLEEANILAIKKSATVFILGSGPSINAIPEQKWSAITKHDSMACNYWAFHNFVPTFYFYEAIGYREGKYFEVFRRITERRAEEYAHCIKIVTGVRELAPEFDLFRPNSWARDLYTVYTIPVAARNELEFVLGLRLARSLGLFSPSGRIGFIFKQASSITGLISLAVRMGYKQIVLCGVDLHSGECFYQDSELYPDGAEVEFQPRNGPHKLIAAQPWMIPTDTAVILMNREILGPAGVKIYVENRSSRLWPAIPQAPDSLFR
jgi:hypothetical protein